jgi:hypothetical protein
VPEQFSSNQLLLLLLLLLLLHTNSSFQRKVGEGQMPLLSMEASCIKTALEKIAIFYF